ncbi:tRNA-dihydrouridine synthase [Candidatus Gracilibacteria bacterium]|nr:tRNA-dihydrouridine synthase [Candidatus Gracilibacteria bacterium]
MNTFWKDLASRGPISTLAPMDGYCDSPYRQIVKKIAPETVVFSEFYSADGIVHSKELQRKALTHHSSEYPLIIQIFGKDPAMFAEAAKIIEGYGITGIDINMGCPAKKVVKSGHGSSLMINRDTAFKIVEEMAKAVKIPVSVKTRLGWENHSLLTEFVQGLENAGASLISVHGRTYKQAFTGRADLTGIYELKQHVNIPVICNGDVMSYEDGLKKIIHPEGLKNLDGFMIGRASFGNPWCFLPGNYEPTLGEILDVMKEHGDLLWTCKERKGMMEARKHLVQYLHGFPGVKEYRSSLVHVESPVDIYKVLEQIKRDHKDLISQKISSYNAESQMVTWGDCAVD